PARAISSLDSLFSSMKPGRKQVITPEITKALCDIISRGNSCKTAFDSLAVPEMTFYHRLQRDGKFRKAIAGAKAEAKKKLIKVVEEAAITDWRAAAWILERSYREEYGKSWADEHRGTRISINLPAAEHARRLRQIFGVKQ